MSTRTKIAALLLLSVVLYSCKQNKKDMILGTWHATKLENADIDSFFINSQHYIDTMGKGNSPEANIALYGTANLDSLRKEMQLQRDSAKSMQDNAVTSTVFNFIKDSTLVTTFGGIADTCTWHIQEDKYLVMLQITGAAKGTGTKMDILNLSASELKLKFEQDGKPSTVTFNRSAK